MWSVLHLVLMTPNAAAALIMKGVAAAAAAGLHIRTLLIAPVAAVRRRE
jgi:hypothetical protein